ncbi:hypothetical protein BsWGS_06176 [Bradybaena similaris]
MLYLVNLFISILPSSTLPPLQWQSSPFYHLQKTSLLNDMFQHLLICYFISPASSDSSSVTPHLKCFHTFLISFYSLSRFLISFYSLSRFLISFIHCPGFSSALFIAQVSHKLYSLSKFLISFIHCPSFSSTLFIVQVSHQLYSLSSFLISFIHCPSL